MNKNFLNELFLTYFQDKYKRDDGPPVRLEQLVIKPLRRSTSCLYTEARRCVYSSENKTRQTFPQKAFDCF
ncbi:hypothetical protein RRG08_040076 [Elysia crispata]|uniref:Uncharacterized protein n=1 Tax=Elysia crispata TaxID=231223 RepID=A0AAE0XVT9_9GAST|nr:hypothetical protein RRG08_040076 [Elysia crispata]